MMNSETLLIKLKHKTEYHQ